ncbi:hypothetical protein N8I77_007814 [Diaporthe amygdali]|uniref:Heparan-alpha-glucosaminide N-acetyltransferase catalytic domain-containing protein n=1 Tax=Phomopsis amygdali TaxID=1214568 RepID=A0AAD9SDJ8_PHOAM|nr:hypothetical protein N8I77_007814 [Diaporthe amygdali]
MEDAVRAVPDASVQETSFQDDALTDNDDAGRHGQGHHQQQQTTTTQSVTTNSQSQYGSVSRPEASEHPTSSQSPIQHAPSKLTAPAGSTARALAPDLLRGLMMVLMALDHNTLALSPWEHETAIHGEVDSGEPVHQWNRPIAYVTRSLTHLCAAGFTFLLGMGVVYFGRSRRALGWSTGRMFWHFFARAVVLTLICIPMGLVLTLGKVWFMNVVLFALAVDYLLAGLLWLIISRTEESLAFGLLKILPDAKRDDASEPLLADRRGEEDIAPDRKIIRASDISWHLHNTLLLALAVVTIWWNLWLSPTGAHCKARGSTHDLAVTMDLSQNNWLDIWFHPFITGGFVSGYPPLAWVSFAILGLLYGRIVLARPWTKTVLTVGNIMAALAFLVVFVLTRVLQFGDLSKGCLHMPEHEGSPNANPYLASWPSFFYLVKYPPDVAFWSYGVGFSLLLLAIFGTIPRVVASTVLDPLVTYGTSALFFYITHLVLLFATRLIWLPRFGHERKWEDPQTGNKVMGIDSLWIYWLNLVLVLAVLYPLCRWYGAFKKTKGPDSLWRFF